MTGKMRIELNKVRLYGYHGLDTGEEIIGGEFEVSVAAVYTPKEVPIIELGQTVDYTKILEVVKNRMKKPAFLLETLATEIASEIIAKFEIVTEVLISISKLHPPITNFEGSVGVCFTLKRS